MRLHRLSLLALLLALQASAHASGLDRCAGHGGVEAKIAACEEASQSTSYPWVLHWVHSELARAYRERGDAGAALANYARSLAAAERQQIRREMEELAALLTQ